MHNTYDGYMDVSCKVKPDLVAAFNCGFIFYTSWDPSLPPMIKYADVPLVFTEYYQVWSLSSFEVSRQLLMNYLNHVWFVSLIMAASTALTNEGLFELTWRSLSFAETTKELG